MESTSSLRCFPLAVSVRRITSLIAATSPPSNSSNSSNSTPDSKWCANVGGDDGGASALCVLLPYIPPSNF